MNFMIRTNLLKNRFIPVLILGSLLFLSSCINLQTYHAVSRSGDDAKNFFHSDSRIRYSVEQDSEYVYLNLSTYKFSSQVKMLRHGFTVYIDEEGKKEENKSWTYPVKSSMVSKPEQRDRRQAKKPVMTKNRETRNQKLFRSFKMNPGQIHLQGFGKEVPSAMNYPDNRSPVKLNIQMDSTGNLLYQAKIPKDEIFDHSESNDGQFSFGIKSGSREKKEQHTGESSNGSMNQRNQMGGVATPGGNQRRGRSRGRGRGQGKNRDSKQVTRKKNELNVPIDFWFRVDLNKSNP